MTFFKFISAIVLFNYVICGDLRVDPLVRIRQGLVRGQKATDGDYSTFLGIPYAQIDHENPLGSSEPHAGFGDDIFNANDGSVKCPQQAFSQKSLKSESQNLDCLILNIYVPNQASSQNPLPVLVWIHGGYFSHGSAGEYHPRELLKHGIIVVTVNYRVGAYGFICLDTPKAPGNQGLKDQNEALQWIRDNIAMFGGNPYQVTIAGQDAGSSATLLHLYSSKDKLFNRIIAESGTPLNEDMFVEGDSEAAIKIAEHLGYSTNNTEQALDFMSTTSSDLITAAVEELSLNLKPCKEKSFSGVDNFIESDPFAMNNEKKVKSTPIIIGHNAKEISGALYAFADEYFESDPFYNKIKNNFNIEGDQLEEAASIVRHFYIGDDTISKELTPELEKFESDFIYEHAVRRSISKLLEQNAGPIYQYVFSYNTGTSAAHFDELFYLFDMPYQNFQYGEDRELITERVTTLWANFVKDGNPTPVSSDLLSVTWEPVTVSHRFYLDIDTELLLKSFVDKERMSFWDLFYNAYGNSHKLARECKKQ